MPGLPFSWRAASSRAASTSSCWCGSAFRWPTNSPSMRASSNMSFLTDYSGFFATGLLAYEIFRGRRDIVVQVLLALSVATATFHAVHGLEWLALHTHAGFNPWIAASICMMAMALIVWTPRLPRPPLPPKLILALGGLTYPFYLLHQKVGYVLLNRFAEGTWPLGATFAVYVFGMMMIGWLIWLFIDRPARRLTKRIATAIGATVFEKLKTACQKSATRPRSPAKCPRRVKAASRGHSRSAAWASGHVEADLTQDTRAKKPRHPQQR